MSHNLLRCWLPLAALVAVSVSACSQPSLLFTGIGDTAYVSGATEKRALDANDYLNVMCRRAGEPCAAGDDRGVDWKSVVLSAFNDVDERCSAYLGALDQAKRDKRLIKATLGEIESTTTTLLGFIEPGSAAIDYVIQAFGFASTSVDNYYSRLILNTEKGTVIRLVTKLQTSYRSHLLSRLGRSRRIDGRVGVHFAVRGYLRLCLPATIEAEINATLHNVGYATPGKGASGERTADARISSVLAAVDSVPLIPRAGGRPYPDDDLPDRPPPPPQISDAQVREGLCLPTRRARALADKAATNAISEFRLALGNPPSTAPLSADERKTIVANTFRCDGNPYLTVFEKFRFTPRSGEIEDLHDLLSRAIKNKASPTEAAPFMTDEFIKRAKIDATTRNAVRLIASKLDMPSKDGGINYDLYQKIGDALVKR